MMFTASWDKMVRVVDLEANKVTKYFVDEMIKSKGHFVLRMPPYHCHLNPIGIKHLFKLII